MIQLTNIGSGYGAELVRVLRNDCRDFMTRDTEFITTEQQLHWWNNLDHETQKLYLVWDSDLSDNELGFGYIKVEDDCVLLTGGLDKQYRGKGLGTKLFTRLVSASLEYKKPIRLEVLKTNFAGIRTYQKVGFKIINENDRIIQMEYVNDTTI
jgi:ribosomal protein S18 acetylase RimI-like enzyme